MAAPATNSLLDVARLLLNFTDALRNSRSKGLRTYCTNLMTMTIACTAPLTTVIYPGNSGNFC